MAPESTAYTTPPDNEKNYGQMEKYSDSAAAKKREELDKFKYSNIQKALEPRESMMETKHGDLSNLVGAGAKRLKALTPISY